MSSKKSPKQNPFDKLIYKDSQKNKIYEAVGAEEMWLLFTAIKDIEKHMKFEHFLEHVKGYKKSEHYDKYSKATFVSFHDWSEGEEYPGQFVLNNQAASFRRGATDQEVFPDSYMQQSNRIEELIQEYIDSQKMKLLSETSKTVTTKTTRYEFGCIEVTVIKASNKKKEVVTLNYKGDKLPFLKSKNELHPVVMKPEFIEVINAGNHPWGNAFQFKGKTVVEYPIGHFCIENPTLKEVETLPIILFYHSGHMMFNMEEELLPTPFQLDYIGAGIDNKNYDLPCLLKYLKKHPRVVTPKDEIEITDIPYYNCDEGRNKTISILVMPTKKEMDTMLKMATKKKNEFWSCKFTELVSSRYDYDYLGIHQFRKKEK